MRVHGLALAIGLFAGCGGSGSGATPSGPTVPSNGGTANWTFNGQTWESSGTPPACPSPLVFTTPVDLSRVTSILYPGQIRGTDYRPHGGFRLDGPGETGTVDVVAPLDGMVYRGARYLVNGELQHSFDILHECGILHRFDHLRDLSPKFEQIAAALPAAVEGDSRTTFVAPGQAVAAGETVATSVGFASGNIFFDWGVYDLRMQNDVSADPAWLAQHPGEFAPYAVCWFDYLSPAAASVVRGLPSGDSVRGGMSDYCH